MRQESSNYCYSELLDSKRMNTSQLSWFKLNCLKSCYFVTWISIICRENLKQKAKSYRKPETSSIHLDRRLLVVFGIQNLFSTHCTDALFVGTALAIMRTWLVHRTFTNSTSGELILSIWIKSCFFWGQSFIFIQLSSTTFCGIPCTVFPCIGSDNSTKFLFTFFAHHPPQTLPYAEKQQRLENINSKQGKDSPSGLQKSTSDISALRPAYSTPGKPKEE